GVCSPRRTTREERDRRRPGRRHQSGLRARTGLRRPGRRIACRGDRETDDRRDRPSGRGVGGMKLVYQESQTGRPASSLPQPDLPAGEMPDALRRSSPPRLPEISEPELVRHFTALADRTFGIDTGFYPLGSCTMKHNPPLNARTLGLPGFRDLHPLQEEDASQGALELMWRLQEILAEVVGLPAVSLQPAAGSQGELTGLLLMRAYFADRGEGQQRKTVITA